MTATEGGGHLAFRVGPDADPDRYMLGPAVASGTEGILYRGSITTVTGVELAVAIKMLQPRLLPHMDEWHDRWSEQVELLRSLQVPGVVRVRDGFLGPLPHAPGDAGEGRTLYLVMNWEDGEPLDEWVRRRPDRDPIDALKVLVPVAAALDLMHSGSATGGVPVVHRDVKPSNILVIDDTSVLVDFGLTRGLSTGSRVSGSAGTEGYMAPETAAGIYTPASDRYALAGVAYFVVTGVEPPITHQPEVLRGALASVPALSGRPETVDHLMEMFDEDPGARPDGLANWVGQLRRSSLDLPPEALRPPAPRRHPERRPTPTPTPKPPRPEFVPPDTSTPVPAQPEPARRQAKARPKERRGLKVAFIVLAMLVAGVAFASWPDPPKRVLANHVGALQYEARYELAVQGFRSVTESQFSDLEAGRVVAQSPPGGRWKKGTTVTLSVSKGPELVAVPDLSSRTQEQAVSALAAAGHKVGAVTFQADQRVPTGVIVEWSLKGMLAPKGTAIDLIVSTGPHVGPQPPPPSVLTIGPLEPKSYTTTKFTPSVTFSVKDGWRATLESADHVVLEKTGTAQGRRVDVMRIQRVYERRAFSAVEDALNSVKAFYESLAPWLADKHDHVKAGPVTTAPKFEGANEPGRQLDGTFAPYPYEGCPAQSPTCVILFQLDPFPPEKVETYAYIARQGEKTRFQILNVGDAKIVVALTAQERDFDAFTSEVTAGSLSISKFGDDRRITGTSLHVAPRTGTGPVVVATVTVEGKCRPSDGSTVSIFSQSVAPENRLSERVPIEGGKVVRQINLIGPGPHRIIVMYDGDSNCDSSVSAPAVVPK